MRRHPRLPEILARHGKWHDAKPALICGRAVVTWSEFDPRLNQVANELRGLGVRKGDSVAVLMKNGTDMVEAMFGAIEAVAVAVPLNLSVSDEGSGRTTS